MSVPRFIVGGDDSVLTALAVALESDPEVDVLSVRRGLIVLETSPERASRLADSVAGVVVEPDFELEVIDPVMPPTTPPA